MPTHTAKIVSIQLNNFIHRIDCKATIIELATQHNCSVKRIRRSKNWLLTGEPNQLIEMKKQLQVLNIQWIAEAIHKALPKPIFDLASIVQTNPAMTVNGLIAETGCTLSEARYAIDNAEGFID